MPWLGRIHHLSSAVCLLMLASKLVLWILDILVRIRIRGSVPMTDGSGSDPSLLISGFQDKN
jgi:hypothetical protein